MASTSVKNVAKFARQIGLHDFGRFRFAGSSTEGTPVAERPASIATAYAGNDIHLDTIVTSSLPHSGAEERPAAPPTYRDLVSGAGCIACLDSLAAVRRRYSAC